MRVAYTTRTPVNEPLPESPPRHRRWIEIAAVFTRLGFTAFGGPMAHVALMEDELVTRRKWCDKQRFLDMTAAVNFIPGPNSTELAIHMGFVRGGFPGLVIAGVCFITPAVLIILPIAFLYVRYGSLPQVAPVLHTVSAAIVAVIAVACIRLATSALKTPIAIAIGVMTLTMLVLGEMGNNPVATTFASVQPEIVLLAVAALVGVVWRMRSTPPAALFALPVAALTTNPVSFATSAFDARWLGMVWFFLKVGATLFGSGYVLVSFLQSGLVDQTQWLTSSQLNDAVAVGQFTPGPLLTTATFIGYVLGHSTFGGGDTGGVIGAILATLSIFAPSFVFIALLAPLLERLRKSTIARGALDAMNAAVVVLIGFTIVRMGQGAFTTEGGFDFINLTITLVSVGLMMWKNLNATWLVIAAGAIGAGRAWIG